MAVEVLLGVGQLAAQSFVLACSVLLWRRGRWSIAMPAGFGLMVVRRITAMLDHGSEVIEFADRYLVPVTISMLLVVGVAEQLAHEQTRHEEEP